MFKKDEQEGQDRFEVVVIGGGPAGMIAAARAAELGKKVVLIEKNKSLGKKLLITGKGRANITQAEFSKQEFVTRIGKNGKFLFSALSAFGPKEVIEFFNKMGLKTKVERGKRVFPVSDRSKDALNVLIKNLKRNNVSLILGEQVLGFQAKNKKIEHINLKNRKIFADSFILCTGGKSYPETGSTGEGYNFAKSLGHTIVELAPALTPLKTKENWVKGLQGLSLKNARVSVFQGGKKQDERFGEMLFTHFGLSGPIILDLSKSIGELLKKGETILELDLKPALSFPTLDKRLQRDFEESRNRDFINYLPDLLPQKMVNLAVTMSGIDPRKKLREITKEERKNLLHFLKELKITVIEPMGYEFAIVTKGGVCLKEVDSKTMKSKIISNLSLAGEVLDLDGPTGGFNLQICWSTGYAAGNHV